MRLGERQLVLEGRAERVRRVRQGGQPQVAIGAPVGWSEPPDLRSRQGAYPRPTNGIAVAITVSDWTLASSGRPAM